MQHSTVPAAPSRRFGIFCSASSQCRCLQSGDFSAAVYAYSTCFITNRTDDMPTESPTQAQGGLHGPPQSALSAPTPPPSADPTLRPLPNGLSCNSPQGAPAAPIALPRPPAGRALHLHLRACARPPHRARRLRLGAAGPGPAAAPAPARLGRRRRRVALVVPRLLPRRASSGGPGRGRLVVAGWVPWPGAVRAAGVGWAGRRQGWRGQARAEGREVRHCSASSLSQGVRCPFDLLAGLVYLVPALPS